MKSVYLAVLLIALSSAMAQAETTVERGQYLVTTIGACGNCHTPRVGDDFKITPGTELSGGFKFTDPDIGPIDPPNITPDITTGIGEWTNAQIVNALRNGKRPDGKLLGP